MALVWHTNDTTEFQSVSPPTPPRPDDPEEGPRWDMAQAHYEERKSAWETWRSSNGFVVGEPQADASGRSVEELTEAGMVGLYVDEDAILDTLAAEHPGDEAHADMVESYR